MNRSIQRTVGALAVFAAGVAVGHYWLGSDAAPAARASRHAPMRSWNGFAGANMSSLTLTI